MSFVSIFRVEKSGKDFFFREGVSFTVYRKSVTEIHGTIVVSFSHADAVGVKGRENAGLNEPPLRSNSDLSR